MFCQGWEEVYNKYLQGYLDQCTTFTLLYASVDGMLGAEAEFFIKRLGDFWLQGGKDLIVWW